MLAYRKNKNLCENSGKQNLQAVKYPKTRSKDTSPKTVIIFRST